VFRWRIDVCTHARDSTFGGFQPRYPKVGNLDCLAIRGEQEILWLDVAMNYAALVGVRQARTNLLQTKDCSIETQRLGVTEPGHVAAAQIFENDIVKGSAGQIQRGAMSEATDDVGMTDPIKRNGFILKILDEGTL
jgi:hypothetical protein